MLLDFNEFKLLINNERLKEEPIEYNNVKFPITSKETIELKTYTYNSKVLNFQELYDRMAARDATNIGIDLDNIINNRIGVKKFRTILSFFPIEERGIHSNNTWSLNLILVMSGYITKLKDIKNKELYDFKEPFRNLHVLHNFLTYFKNQCLKNHIEIKVINDKFFLFQEAIYRKNFKYIFDQWHNLQYLFPRTTFSISSHLSQWRGLIYIQYKMDKISLNLNYEGTEFSCNIINRQGIKIEDTNDDFIHFLDLFFESIFGAVL